ncbi:hypothetical protein VUR80DRAFT_7772 [Thermomyces stellatus]
MPSAIVTGATGILGREIVHRLGNNPRQWTSVYAISRSKKEEFPASVKHTFVDLLGSADSIAKDLQGLEAEYVFFSAYVEKATEQENWDVNGDMLQNFLLALEKTGLAGSLKRVVLVTGAKHYGVHLGPPKNPLQETDQRLTQDPFPPNFYYRQQDIVKSFCQKHSHVSWVVTYPNDVIGLAKGNFMNLATSVGIYAAVSKELGEDLAFPGSDQFYTMFDSFTDSKLHAEFCEWAALEPRAANEDFNVVNGDVASWQSLWPLLARKFGMKVKPNQFADAQRRSSETKLVEKPPLSIYESELGLEGRIQRGKIQQMADLVQWSKQSNVKQAWERLADREGLEKDALDKATWAFLGMVLGRNYSIVVNMTKARSLGWNSPSDCFFGLLRLAAADQQCSLLSDLPPNIAESEDVLLGQQRDAAGIWSQAYADKDVDTMMSYVVDDYIQHNPNIQSGKEIAQSYLTRQLASPGLVNNVTLVISQLNFVLLHVHRIQPGHRDRVIVDIYRLDGTCIVEHWDVQQDMDPDAPNPGAFF